MRGLRLSPRVVTHVSEDALLEQLDRGSVRAAVAIVADEPEAADESVVVQIVRGWGLTGAGEPARAQARLRPLVARLEQTEDRRLRAHALLALGVASVLAGEAYAGTALLERALSLHGPPWPRAQCQRFLALALEQRGAWEGAAARYQAAAAAYAAIPDDFGQGSALDGAAAAFVELGRDDEARALLLDGITALRRQPPLPALGAALGLMATLVVNADGDAAIALLAESGALTRDTPWMYRADWLIQSAEVLLRLGRPAEALDHAREAVRITAETATEHVWAPHGVARSLVALGRDEEAAALLATPTTAPIPGPAHLERLSLQLGIAARAHADCERLLDGLDRAVRARHRRRGATARIAAAGHTLAGTDAEGAARALQLAIGLGEPVGPHVVLLRELAHRGARVPLGPLWLERPLGAGGMGEVWRAHHPAGVDVAVKLLLGERPAADVALFEAEIEAVARLDHPHIVRVLAALRVDPAAAAMLDRPVGTAALVMELVGGGALDHRLTGLGWHEVKLVLGQLLDALAHAHARGVLHLDLKPGNVLLDEAAGHLHARLTDFGLAGLARQLDAGRLFGTPAYMAPEQATGGAPLGPAADLYGLGCLAWRLVAGAPVFGHARAAIQVARHVDGRLPALRPSIPVPAGLEGWLRRLLARSPEDRFACAADAAAALATLGEATVGARRPSAPARAEATIDLANLSHPQLPAPPPPLPLPRWAPAPFRPDWRTVAGGSPAPFLRGLGEGLLHVRIGRRIGRARKRDALWSLLAAVHDDGAPRCAWITGPDGMGRTELLDWLAEVAHASGSAWVVRAQDPVAGEAAVRTAPRDRPILVLIDDAETFAARRFVREMQRPNTLVVAASRRAPPDVEPTLHLSLRPLGNAEIRALLDERLPIDRALATRIAARAAGSPGFAVALLTDLIRRDALEPGPEGFRPIDGEGLTLPRDLDTLWSARLDDLAPAGSPRRSAWEIAAVLGPELALDVWARACAAAGLPPDPDALEVPEAEGWIERAGDRLTFRVAPAREALVTAAEASGRSATWHAAAADALKVGDHHPAAAGRHLARAGRHAEALKPLRSAAADAVNTTRIDECRELLALWDSSADALGIAPDDVRRASPLVVRVHLALHSDEDPYPLLARAAALAEGRDPVLESQITYSHAWVLARDGRHAEAERAYLRAIELAQGAGMAEMVAVARLGLAGSVYSLGRDATGLLEQALEIPEAVPPGLPMRIDACAGRGLLRLGRVDEARHRLLLAVQVASARGASDVEAEAAADLADVCAATGDTEGLLRWHQVAVTALEPTGSDKALLATVRLAGALVTVGRDEDARALLAPIRPRFGWRLRPTVAAEFALVEIALGDRSANEAPEHQGRLTTIEPAVRRVLGEIGRRTATAPTTP